MEDIPNQVCGLAGDLSNLKILDLGCGDMLADVGLLGRAPKQITGLDVAFHEWDVVERAVRVVSEAGFPVPQDYASRMSYVPYNGTKFPFADNQFDLIISWSAFEHIPQVREVLDEMRRVVKPQGRAFVQVYPWFHCYWGSHLSDYIDEAYFHLRRPAEWVLAQLQNYVAAHPEQGDFILGHMWSEYRKLNRYSAQLFLRDAMDAGFSIERLESITRDVHTEEAPPEVPLADVKVCGTLVLLNPAKR